MTPYNFAGGYPMFRKNLLLNLKMEAAYLFEMSVSTSKITRRNETTAVSMTAMKNLKLISFIIIYF
jgi:hypothetical protein